MIKSLKFLLKLFIIVGILLSFAYFAGKQALISWAERETVLTQEVLIEIRKGASIREISILLEDNKLLSSAVFFESWVRFFSDHARFQAGPYRFEGSVSPQSIAQMIIRGEVYRPIIVQFTIPEGFTYKQLASRLVALNIGSVEEYAQLFTDKDFLKELNIPSTSLEGFLYPATYPFTFMPSAREAISLTVKTFFERLPPNYEQNIQSLGLNLQEAVTFASLIELETQHDDERSMVAEVIWNRLKRGMALGIDASIIYGIHDYTGNLTSNHLRDETNPYNSRIHRGLPPTPIGSPSVDSLNAILTPTNEGYLYYVLDPDTVNRHTFTKTLAEHNRGVRKLVRSGHGR